MKRSFWLHQVAEYVIGVALVGSGVQSPNPTVPAVLGGLVIVNAAIVDAPLGAFALVGRRVHRLVDIVLVLGGFVATVLPGLDLGTRVVQACCLIVLATVVMNTNYITGTSRDSRHTTDDARSEVTDRPEEIGRRAGRLVGTIASRARAKWRA